MRHYLPGQESIVLVEDDKDDIDLFRECLSSLGCTRPVRAFTDSTEALSYLLKTDEIPFMIVADINMPKLNGIEFRARIRKSKLMALRYAPFFFLSTSFDKQYMQPCFGMMIQGVFIKPSDPTGLGEIVESMLRYSEEVAVV